MPEMIPEILEIVMIVSFGASWPMNVMKSYKARTTKGKSLAFLCLIFFGYIAGIASKFINEAYMASFGQKWYTLEKPHSSAIAATVNGVSTRSCFALRIRMSKIYCLVDGVVGGLSIMKNSLAGTGSFS